MGRAFRESTLRRYIGVKHIKNITVKLEGLRCKSLHIEFRACCRLAGDSSHVPLLRSIVGMIDLCNNIIMQSLSSETWC
jgi:hypothetical protein